MQVILNNITMTALLITTEVDLENIRHEEVI